MSEASSGGVRERGRRAALGGLFAAVLLAIVLVPAAEAHLPEAINASHTDNLKLRASENHCATLGEDGGSGNDPQIPPVTHERRFHSSGDIAFWGTRAIIACGAEDRELDDDGFVVVDISDPEDPNVLGGMRCVASASDVAVYEDLVFLAVDRNGESRADASEGKPHDPYEPRLFSQPGPEGDKCDAPVVARNRGLGEASRTDLFAGVRVVSIADPRKPKLLASVKTNQMSNGDHLGAHGITVVPDPDEDRLLVYAASPGQLIKNDIVGVPLDRPKKAAVLEHEGSKFVTPAGPPDVAHGCHDIAVFLPRGLASCTTPPLPGGTSRTTLFSIGFDPPGEAEAGEIDRPVVLSSIVTRGRPDRVDHSSTFSWDGEVLVVTDESLVGLLHRRCLDRFGAGQGALHFYDVSDPLDLKPLADQGPHPVVDDVAWCHPKQVGVVPLRDGRDVVVTSWLGGGTTVVDFTDRTKPKEIAQYVVPDETWPWSSYWYNGYIFANNAFGCSPWECFGIESATLDVLAMDFDPNDVVEGEFAEAFEDAVDLPFHNSYYQQCLPAPFGLAHGPEGSSVHESCKD